jgi:hypothetical protein
MALLRSRWKMATPTTNTMKSKNLLTTLLLLGLTTSAWAQTAPVETKPQAARPLNLSLPRDLLHGTPGAAKADDPVTRNLRPEPSSGGRHGEHMPYGTGYEARRQGVGSGNSGTSPGDGGRGRGDRGGMGRRR